MYFFLKEKDIMYSQTCVQGLPLGLKKVAVVQNWSLFKGRSLNITINIETLGIMPAVVDRWPLLKGGC
jgi:hypothetical protein